MREARKRKLSGVSGQTLLCKVREESTSQGTMNDRYMQEANENPVFPDELQTIQNVLKKAQSYTINQNQESMKQCLRLVKQMFNACQQHNDSFRQQLRWPFIRIISLEMMEYSRQTIICFFALYQYQFPVEKAGILVKTVLTMACKMRPQYAEVMDGGSSKRQCTSIEQWDNHLRGRYDNCRDFILHNAASLMQCSLGDIRATIQVNSDRNEYVGQFRKVLELSLDTFEYFEILILSTIEWRTELPLVTDCWQVLCKHYKQFLSSSYVSGSDMASSDVDVPNSDVASSDVPGSADFEAKIGMYAKYTDMYYETCCAASTSPGEALVIEHPYTIALGVFRTILGDSASAKFFTMPGVSIDLDAKSEAAVSVVTRSLEGNIPG